jgi:hypothetical protein
MPTYAAEQNVPDDKWFEIIEHNLNEKYDQLLDQLKHIEALASR